MTIQIDIPDEKTQFLSNPAFETLKEVGSEYLNVILDESERLALANNTTNTPTEITASIVKDAVVYQRKYKKPKKTKNFIWIQIALFISSLIAGGLFDTDKFSQLGYFIAFLIFFTIAVVTGIISIVLGVNND